MPARPPPNPDAIHDHGSNQREVKIKKVFVDGDDVCVLYDLSTNSPAGTAFICEWIRFRGGKIASVRAVLDAGPFAAAFGGGWQTTPP
jgi:hypothetical protein